MSARNYLSVPNTYSAPENETNSDDSLEVLGYVMVEHFHYSKVPIKFEPFSIFEGRTEQKMFNSQVHCSEFPVEIEPFKTFERQHEVEKDMLSPQVHFSQLSVQTEPFKTFERRKQRTVQETPSSHGNCAEVLVEIEALKLFERRKQEVEQETLKSVGRSLCMLHESEVAAASTGQELLRQREQLQRTDQRLDEIRDTLQESKNHIRAIQGVFGGVKSYIAKKCRSRTPSPNKSDPSSGSAKLKSALVSLSVEKGTVLSGKSAMNHTGLKIRGLQPDPWETADCTTHASNVDVAIEKNLELMSSSIQRLKGAALGLSDELDSEKELIERVIAKTDKANSAVVVQTKELTQLNKKVKWF